MATLSRSEIADKIRKLLALAEGAGTEAEAANAAGRAAALTRPSSLTSFLRCEHAWHTRNVFGGCHEVQTVEPEVQQTDAERIASELRPSIKAHVEEQGGDFQAVEGGWVVSFGKSDDSPGWVRGTDPLVDTWVGKRVERVRDSGTLRVLKEFGFEPAQGALIQVDRHEATVRCDDCTFTCPRSASLFRLVDKVTEQPEQVAEQPEWTPLDDDAQPRSATTSSEIEALFVRVTRPAFAERPRVRVTYADGSQCEGLPVYDPYDEAGLDYGVAFEGADAWNDPQTYTRWGTSDDVCAADEQIVSLEVLPSEPVSAEQSESAKVEMPEPAKVPAFLTVDAAVCSQVVPDFDCDAALHGWRKAFVEQLAAAQAKAKDEIGTLTSRLEKAEALADTTSKWASDVQAKYDAERIAHARTSELLDASQREIKILRDANDGAERRVNVLRETLAAERSIPRPDVGFSTRRKLGELLGLSQDPGNTDIIEAVELLVEGRKKVVPTNTASVVINDPTPDKLRQYIGRRVKVYAVDKSSGLPTLKHNEVLKRVEILGQPYLALGGAIACRYDDGASTRTVVEVLPEQAVHTTEVAEPDAAAIEPGPFDVPYSLDDLVPSEQRQPEPNKPEEQRVAPDVSESDAIEYLANLVEEHLADVPSEERVRRAAAFIRKDGKDAGASDSEIGQMVIDVLHVLAQRQVSSLEQTPPSKPLTKGTHVFVEPDRVQVGSMRPGHGGVIDDNGILVQHADKAIIVYRSADLTPVEALVGRTFYRGANFCTLVSVIDEVCEVRWKGSNFGATVELRNFVRGYELCERETGPVEDVPDPTMAILLQASEQASKAAEEKRVHPLAVRIDSSEAAAPFVGRRVIVHCPTRPDVDGRTFRYELRLVDASVLRPDRSAVEPFALREPHSVELTRETVAVAP